ncbi:hypothetical protein [Natrialba sp. SSL1]|uniref:hypothetical protein n=1 Tax=Natrialba sp. SSL1 TaxID=1869245 RepID=UPI0008F82B95|nr:hypothetical protein [Natrialba sp. SSL1]OIB58179.1 hypothetical protein BBD46_09880 [Natrialba sp. SSL1]
MASDNDTPVDPDAFVEPSVDDSPTGLDLDPGEEYIGTITDYRPWAGDNGLVEIDGEPVWLNRTLQKQLIAALVQNSPVMYCKSDEEESFEDEDGEETAYHPRSFRFPDNGGD